MIAKPSIQHLLLAQIDRILWHAPDEVKKFLNRDGLFTFDHISKQWK